MKSILIVAPFCSLPGEPQFNRFLYLANFLSRSSYDVTLVTSRFRHADKKQRNDIYTGQLKIVLIDEPGYKKNVSLARVFSHYLFCRGLKKWFLENRDFDFIYSAYPLIESNRIIGKYKKPGTKLVVDVQDVWPESVSSFLPLCSRVPANWIPFSAKANSVYASSNALVAVSKTYLNRASLAYGDGMQVPSEVVYIGSDFDVIQEVLPKSLEVNCFHLVYIGTLSHSYDMKTVVKSVIAVLEHGLPIRLHILGCGPLEQELRRLAKNRSEIIFHGLVNYKTMFSFLKGADVGVNAICSGASQSVTNKLSDYLAIGIPVLNCQSCQEARQLIEMGDYGHYKAGCVVSCTKTIMSLYMRRKEIAFRPNSLFNRSCEYRKIVDIFKRLDGLSKC